MNPPRKPWEISNSHAVTNSTELLGNEQTGNPPPVPSRPLTRNSMYQPPHLSGYGSMYNNPYQNMYPGSTGYGYSPYNFGGGSFGLGGGNNIPLLSDVEKATHTIFTSAESLVRAFTSVSMMLESTLFAVRNSIQAVVSVADQFSHLRVNLLNSIVAIIHNIKYYLRKFMYFFKVGSMHTDTVTNELSSSRSPSKHWPVLLFFAIVFGAPWLLWKFFSSVAAQHARSNAWQKGNGEHILAEVKFSFQAENIDELSVSSGDVIRVAPKDRQPRIKGWILVSDGERQGLVPANYIQILGKSSREAMKKSEILAESITGQTEEENVHKLLENVYCQENENR